MVYVQNTLCINALVRWATDAQKRFLPKLARNTVGSYALSEAGSGSDAGSRPGNHVAAWAKQRRQFGKSLVEFQAMQFQLAQLATDIEMARLAVYNAARPKDNGSEFLKEAAMCKLVASDVTEKVASIAVEVLGGSGFVKDYPSKNSTATQRSAKSTREPPHAACHHCQADARTEVARRWQTKPVRT